MSRRSINRSLCLVALIGSLLIEKSQAAGNLGAKNYWNNKLYHERNGPQIEEVFRKLPSIENEIESLFDDASFLSSFGASPQVNNKANKDVEDLFRRILLLKGGGKAKARAEDRNLSFLGNQLEDAGVFGGDGIRNRGGVRGGISGQNGMVPGLSEEQQMQLANDFGAAHQSDPQEPKAARTIGKADKAMKSFKGLKSEKKEKEHKIFKKGKRYKEEKGKVENKLQKLNKLGKKEKNFGYDPHVANDDYAEVNDDFHFGNWEWEFAEDGSEEEEAPLMKQQANDWEWGTVDEEPQWDFVEHDTLVKHKIDNPFDESDSFFKDSSKTFGGVGGFRSDPQPIVPQNGGSMTGRIDEVMDEGEYEFGNFMIGQFEAVTDNIGGPGQFEKVVQSMGGPTTSMTITSKQVGHYKFNFPSIQHTLFTVPIQLKAHSNVDLSPMDPEIFAVLQSVMTPYLQQTIGSELHAYNLEVDYSPGNDYSVNKLDIVTLMKVKCTFKVVSDSIESFRSMDHDLASKWIHDYFDGPEIYKLIEGLKYESIPINDITFFDEQFKTSNTVSSANIVSYANSQSFGNSRAPNRNNERSVSGAAMVGVTLSVIMVGMLFFMHYTGRLPSKAQIGEFSLKAQDSIKHTRDIIKERLPSPSIKLGKKRRGNDEIEGGRRKRTFSGTFRRFPVGGLQKAAIQKKPAKSEHYLGDNASQGTSSSINPRTFKKSSSFSDPDDYSFSHYGGDYGPGTPSRQSSIPPMTPMSRHADDEFSMPDNYDSEHDGRRIDALLGKVGKTATYLMSPMKKQQQYAEKSPIPSRAPRRITAKDIASPAEVDNWSIQSYESQNSSQHQRSPSDHHLYRGWNESDSEMRRPVLPSEQASSAEKRRQKLSMPYFK